MRLNQASDEGKVDQDMRKFQTVILALVAVSAFGAVLTASASAEVTLVALWLANGLEITANLASETSGSLLLEDTKAPLVGKAAALCSAILDGVVGANGTDEIREVLNLAKELISSTPLTGLPLTSANGDCVNETNCGTPIELWPLKLPWKTQLFLMENGEILDLVVGSGYELLCTVGGLNVIDECTAADTELLIENDPETGDASSPAGAAATPNALCTLSSEETGVNVVDELSEIKLVNGELLTVSSE
jgi:hypothetical protein